MLPPYRPLRLEGHLFQRRAATMSGRRNEAMQVRGPAYEDQRRSPNLGEESRANRCEAIYCSFGATVAYMGRFGRWRLLGRIELSGLLGCGRWVEYDFWLPDANRPSGHTLAPVKTSLVCYFTGVMPCPTKSLRATLQCRRQWSAARSRLLGFSDIGCFASLRLRLA